MKISIIREDNMVVVDREPRTVDLSGMNPLIHAVQFNSARGAGEVEFDEDGEGRRQVNATLDAETFDASFGWCYTAWEAAAPPAPTPPTLSEIKAEAKAFIDAAAGGARMRYITSVPGQDAVYLVKAEEAAAYAAAGYTGDVPPHIAAEAAETGQTAQQVAEMVLAMRAQWVGVLSPAIEGKRIGGKAAVNAAADAAAVVVARDAALAALGAI